MNKKIIFQKSYTRDTTLVIQQIWHHALVGGIKDNFGIVCPAPLISVDYINNGVIEIWENKKALDFIKKKLVLGIINKPKFFLDFIADYEKALERFAQSWNHASLPSKEFLIFFIREVNKYVSGDLLITYLSEQGEVNNKVAKKAKELRSKDQYFSSNDNIIRKSIVRFYPEIADYAVTIKFSEIIKGCPPSIKECERRFKNFISASNGYCAIETLAEFKKKNLNLVFEEENKKFKSNFFIGETAFKGLVIGQVKIVHLISELDKINQGDVLVSPMTTPMFVSAMKRAAGIITDEGGILSHAAIIARELKKPCIIGTKIATKVLRDGDLVEVDADKGIVKILKRKK